MSVAAESGSTVGETPDSSSTPAEASKRDTVLAVKPSTLLKLWERWRQQGHASFDEASETQLCALWCEVARSSAWDELEITRCLVSVRTRLKKDSTMKPTVLEDGSLVARFDRWLHHILLQRSLPRVRASLESLWQMLESKGNASHAALVSADPEILHKLHLALAAKDIDRCIRWKLAELLHMYHDFLCEAHQACPDSALGADSFVTEVLGGLGLRGDETLTYPEFLSLFTGRVESDVVLYMYDLSSGAAKVMKYAEGIWHTSVQVFGYEYLYSGRCVYVDPGDSCFGKPTKKLSVGSTLCRRSEFHNFCCGKLSSTFTTESYHLLRNNCNHFSDKVLNFLCGAKVPHDIMHQADRLLKLPGMGSLWPVMTNWVPGLAPCQSQSEEIIREQTEPVEPAELGSSKEQYALTMNNQQLFKVPRSDEMSSTTAATEAGCEISISIADVDSGAVPLAKDETHWLMLSIEEDIKTCSEKEYVPPQRGCFFPTFPFSARR